MVRIDLRNAGITKPVDIYLSGKYIIMNQMYRGENNEIILGYTESIYPRFSDWFRIKEFNYNSRNANLVGICSSNNIIIETTETDIIEGVIMRVPLIYTNVEGEYVKTETIIGTTDGKIIMAQSRNGIVSVIRLGNQMMNSHVNRVLDELDLKNTYNESVISASSHFQRDDPDIPIYTGGTNLPHIIRARM